MRDKKRIGVLVVTIDSYVQDLIWSGIEMQASRLGYEILFFCGTSLDGPNTNLKHLNVIYDLVNTQELDGLIIYAGSLGNYCGYEALYEFVNQLSQVPIVSIGIDFPEHHNVLMSNELSMRHLLRHLIEKHQYKKIAYISGPKSNQEARIRLEAYKSALCEANIAYDETLVYYGDFSRGSGETAARIWLEDEKIDLECIVAANDDMALGAYKMMQHQGIIVGTQMGLTGFDDTEACQTIFPPLTSIKQPYFEMGLAAVSYFRTIFEGVTTKHTQALAGRTIIRQSCGCLRMYSETLDKVQVACHPKHNESGEQVLDKNIRIAKWLKASQKKIVDEMLTVIDRDDKVPAYAEQMNQLIEAFIEDVIEERLEGHFLNLLNYYVSLDAKEQGMTERWQNVLYLFYLYVNQCGVETEWYSFVNKLFYFSNTLLGNVIRRSEQSQTLALRAIYFASSRIVQRFHQIVSEEALIEELKYQMKEQEIELLTICTYDKPVELKNGKTTQHPLEVNVLFSWESDKVIKRDRYLLKNMLPVEVDYESHGIHKAFYPLVFQSKLFGFMIIDSHNAQKLIVRSIKAQVENALERIFWYQRVDNYNKQLEYLSNKDSLTGLNNRHGYFEKVNEQYKIAIQEGLDFELIYCDMDGLKGINDTFGHQEGDRAILLIANLLTKVFVDSDNVARLGGDEFVIIRLLDDKSVPVEQLIDEFGQQLDSEIKNEGIAYLVGLSFGIARYREEINKELESLMHMADKRLYDEKNRRRLIKKLK